MMYNLQQGLRVGKLSRKGFHDRDIMSLFVDKSWEGRIVKWGREGGGGLKGAGTRGGKGRDKYFCFETSS